eukprot:28599-Alexandrium_andersonii.AAC.1
MSNRLRYIADVARISKSAQPELWEPSARKCWLKVASSNMPEVLHLRALAGKVTWHRFVLALKAASTQVSRAGQQK